jgi:dihydrofolate reductase
MNSARKVVYSRTLEKAGWTNTRIVTGGLIEEVRRLKAQDGKGLTVLDSGSIVPQLAQAGLIGDREILPNPIAIGGGKSMFEGLKDRMTLKGVKTRAFGNGNFLLTYEARREDRAAADAASGRGGGRRGNDHG